MIDAQALFGSARTLGRAIGSPTDLTAEESASTLFRVFRSRHVADLRLIFWLIVFLAITLLIFAVPIGLWISPSNGKREFIEFLFKYVSAVLGGAGLIVAWAYRSASARLGVVDLFAAEISTLCRVGTVVDIAAHYVALYSCRPPTLQPADHDGAESKQTSFVSQEDYFPIFDKNANDLQILEAKVVTHISEFYTYMKATRDTQRALSAVPASTDPGPAYPSPDTPPTPWCAAVANVIYMLFLGYESARKAIDDLIEYEPNAAETKMVILVTELSCYGFLCKFFGHDQLRYARLNLRERDYKELAPRLYGTVREHEKEKDWQRAARTLQALAERYSMAFGEVIAAGVPPQSDAHSRAALEEPGLV